MKRKVKPRPGAADDVARLHCNEWGVWHWKPEKKLRPQFKGRSLGRDEAAAIAEALRLNREVEDWQKDATLPAAQRPAPRRRSGQLTVAQMISRWRHGDDGQGSDDWRGNRPRTQHLWRSALKRIEAEFGDEAAELLTRGRVKQWSDPLKRRAPGTARSYVTCARRLFSWAIDVEILKRKDNPFGKLGLKGAKKRARLFSFADIRHLVAVADGKIAPPPRPEGERKLPAFQPRPSIGTALVLGFACVQRIWDIIELGAHNLVAQPDGSTRLVFDQSKSRRVGDRFEISPGVHIDVRLPQLAAARLTAAPPLRVRDERLNWRPLIVSEKTRLAYNEQTIGKTFTLIVKRAIACDPQAWGHLAGMQLRDARRSGFVHLRRLGLNVEQIVNLSGHTLEEGYRIVEHYMPRTSDEADQVAAMMTGEL